MTKFTTHDREFMRMLCANMDGISLYSLHKERKFSPGQIASTVNWMEREGLIELEGLTARLTSSGRTWILKKRREIFMNVDRHWAQPTLRMPGLENPRGPYMPKLTAIDARFFQKRD